MDAEHHHIVVKMMLNEIVEAIYAVWRPGTRDVHGEIAARGFKFSLECFGSLLFEHRRTQQGSIVACRGGFSSPSAWFWPRRSLRGSLRHHAPDEANSHCKDKTRKFFYQCPLPHGFDSTLSRGSIKLSRRVRSTYPITRKVFS